MAKYMEQKVDFQVNSVTKARPRKLIGSQAGCCTHDRVGLSRQRARQSAPDFGMRRTLCQRTPY